MIVDLGATLAIVVGTCTSILCKYATKMCQYVCLKGCFSLLCGACGPF